MWKTFGLVAGGVFAGIAAAKAAEVAIDLIKDCYNTPEREAQAILLEEAHDRQVARIVDNAHKQQAARAAAEAKIAAEMAAQAQQQAQQAQQTQK